MSKPEAVESAAKGSKTELEKPENPENGENSENCEEFVTMLDVLEQQEEDEENVIAVLGGADDNKCTYSQGYMKRQPLYACKTCALKNPNPRESPGGVCLACSYKCHEGHDLVELYTKRNFRCDCGNNRFPTNMCMLEPMKDNENECNLYNQNFEGVYCICHRPYPDPENENDDQMFQCAVCEDWYHSLHLDTKMPPVDEFDELICQLCMKKYAFLWIYQETKEFPKDCKIKNAKIEESKSGTTFWKTSWRENLCTCNSCCDMYKESKIEFLLDASETPSAYEKENKERARASSQQMEMEALSSLNRVQQIEAIQSYNDMKTQLKDFLQNFATTGRVVSPDDITNFFTKMKAKRMRMDSSYVPPTCR